jgi:iron complex transport system substrate-binding protein
MSSGRIIPLIASRTEILCELGFEDQLIGRSHECDPQVDYSLPYRHCVSF